MKIYTRSINILNACFYKLYIKNMSQLFRGSVVNYVMPDNRNIDRIFITLIIQQYIFMLNNSSCC